MAKSAKKKTTDSSTVAEGADKLGRHVRHFIQDGKHYVEANRNGAVHPVECESEAAAKKLYKEECDVA